MSSCDEGTTEIQGVVVATNDLLWSFDLNNDRVVYMPHLAAFQETPFLPKIGSNVTINHVHYETISPYFINRKQKIFYLCDESYLCCNCVVNVTENTLLKLIKNYHLTLEDFKDMLSKIRNEFTLICRKNVEEFAFSVYETLAKISEGVFCGFVFKTVSRCKYINSEMVICERAPYWSFGCHPSKTKEILLGKFTMFEKYGVFLLYDCDYKIMCVIKGRKREILMGLIDNFVLIRNFVIFTESFKDYDRGIDYLFCDINDICVVNFNYKTADLCCNTTKKTLNVLLLNKSMPILNTQNKPYFILQLKNLDVDKEENFFLSITNLQIYQFLQTDCIYFLKHNNNFVETTDIELKRLYPNIKHYQLNDDQLNFQLQEKLLRNENLNIEEAMSYLKTGNNCLISFQGTIKEKDFCPPLSSRTKRDVNIFAYGTPGKKTHLLHFKTNDTEKTIILYLNNWETIQMPFGLLPDMEILVQNVLPQKQKYFKSTILTNFEILNYVPKIPFETANLCSEDGFVGNWGNPYNLGVGYLLPDRILVYTKIETLKIRSLKLFYACLVCPKTITRCEHDLTLQTAITMIVTDSGGKAMVICKSLEVLRVIFDLLDCHWEDFCESCKKIECYQYNKNATVDELDFSGALTAIINVINEIGLSDVEMLCRKLDSKLEDNNMLPLWLCVQARKK